jgi:dTDP-4-amino-4,6-dideoxy-D-galactose acyltransferase
MRLHAGSTVLTFLAGSTASSETAETLAYNLMLRDLVSGSIEAIGSVEDNGLTGAVLWQELEWDSKVLGIGCARLLLAAGENLEAILSFWKERALELGIQYATVRVPLFREVGQEHEALDRREDVCELCAILQKTGFERIERLLYLSRSTEAPLPAHSVGQASLEDMETIEGIASNAYRYDRFHSEPFFSKEVADKVHAAWARSSFAGRADEVLHVRDEERRIVGYCTCILPEPRDSRPGWIDTLAVSTDTRRRGVGESLALGALSLLRGAGFREAALSTQENNRPAMNLYDKLGFTIYGAVATYRLILPQDV